LAFLYGWKCFLVMDPGITAALGVGLASYAASIIPLSPLGMKLVAGGAVLVIAAANIVGVRIGARVLQWLALVKIGSLLFIILWGFVGGLGKWSNLVPFAAQRPGSSPLFAALAGGLLA